jgi:hypothetical protein
MAISSLKKKRRTMKKKRKTRKMAIGFFVSEQATESENLVELLFFWQGAKHFCREVCCLIDLVKHLVLCDLGDFYWRIGSRAFGHLAPLS